MTLEEVEAEVRAMLERLRHPCPDFHFDRTPMGDASPHVEGDGPEFDWVVSERGTEHSRQRVDGAELLFVAMESLTAGMARGEELATRTALKVPLHRRILGGAGPCVADDYSRRTWIEAHVRLMSFLRSDWGARAERHYDEILRRYPLTPEERANARRLDLRAYGLPD